MDALSWLVLCTSLLALRWQQGRNRRDLREHETISVEPVWVLWVKGHEFVEENVGDRRHAHRGTGMTGVGIEGGIDLMSNDGQSDNGSVADGAMERTLGSQEHFHWGWRGR